MNMTDTWYPRSYAPVDGFRESADQANPSVDSRHVQAGHAASGPFLPHLRSFARLSRDGDQRGAADRAMGLLFVHDVRWICLSHADTKAPRVDVSLLIHTGQITTTGTHWSSPATEAQTA